MELRKCQEIDIRADVTCWRHHTMDNAKAKAYTALYIAPQAIYLKLQ